MTQPSLATAQAGDAADAVRTLQAGLGSDYAEMRSAEIQLTEAILSAHAVTVSGRAQLQDIQRQLVEAITNPVAALGTPAGERHFLLFLRSKIAEMQAIVDAGALTDEDHAKLTRALGSGYLVTTPERDDPRAESTSAAQAGGAPAADQGAGMMPAIGSALGALPQAAQGAATAPAQGASGLAGAAGPLAGLASGLLERGGEGDAADGRIDRAPAEQADIDEQPDAEDTEAAEDAESEDTDTDTDTEHDDPAEPREPDDREPPKSGPTPTRPARLL